MAVVDEAKLRYLDFLSREDRVRHHRYVEEMKQYDMMRAGDINAIAESTRLWDSGLYGYLSDDPLTDMMTFFTWAMADMQKAETHSKAVNECLDYIHYHLHEKITVPILAEHVHLNPTYLSELFKRETGTAISQYITDKRMEAAENMLKYSEYSFDEIAQILAYRSQSHFSKVFKKHSGMTPGEYRTKYAQNGIWPE